MTLPPRMIAPARRPGLGSAPALVLPPGWSQAQADYQNQFVSVVTAGDTYYNAGETAQALTTYQAAGAAGATAVGPEIDLLGYPSVSQPWTQKAWKANALLAATTIVADAQTYAKNMQLYYTIAFSAVQDRANGFGVPLPTVGPSQLVYGVGIAFAAGALYRLGVFARLIG